MFTGDRSGDFLYGVLHKTGFASQPHSVSRGDGLELRDAYIGASVRCAPPDNKPSTEEVLACRATWYANSTCLPRLRVVVALGKLAFDNYLAVLKQQGRIASRAPFRFGHNVEHRLGDGLRWLIGVLSSEPAEYEHRETDRGDACRRVSDSGTAPLRLQ